MGPSPPGRCQQPPFAALNGGQRLWGQPCDSRSQPRHGGSRMATLGRGLPTRAAHTGHAVVVPCLSPEYSGSTPIPKQCSSPSLVFPHCVRPQPIAETSPDPKRCFRHNPVKSLIAISPVCYSQLDPYRKTH